MSQAVTVVVATRNRRDELLRTVIRHEAPTVVVDNASSDGTAEAAAALPDVEVIELARNLGAYARTVGARHATTPYVAFADDDSWWAPGALVRAVDIMQRHPRLAVLAAQVRVMPRDELDPICKVMAESALGRPDDLPGRSVVGFVACAAVVHRGAFLSVGGFDDVVRFPGEEERVALDVAAAGLGLAYVPEVLAYHEPSAYRETRALRRTQLARSALLTGVLRRPWTAVRREALGALRGGPSGRRGLAGAVPRLPRALLHRSAPPSLD